MPNELGCRELGKKYAAGAFEFMSRELGGKSVELAEIEFFHASAVSWLTAQAFCLVLEKAGPEEAERFLQLVMAGTSACVRLKEAPFMLTMSAELRPIEEEAPSETGDGEQAPDGGNACNCRLTNGECPTCPKALKLSYFELSKFVLSYLKETQARADDLSRSCRACGARYADRVISELVNDGISSAFDREPEELKQQAVAVALQTITVFGVNEAPLTVGALRKRQQG